MNETVKPSPRFLSLAALRLAHRELLQRHRQDGSSPQLLEEIAVFVREGVETGLLLDNLSERQVAQDLLDYWSNVLHHDSIEHPDPILAPFDISLAPDLDESLCPYVGLNAFQAENQGNFFGRKERVEEMLEILKAGRFLAILGSSGSGKSSVAMAGLMPALQAGAMQGSAEWRYLPRLVPGPAPLENLAALFPPGKGAHPDWAEQQAQRFLADHDELLRLANALEKPVFLLVDQFEELFTLGADEQTQQAYIANLLTMIQEEGSPHVLVITMRTDYESYLARFENLQGRVNTAVSRLEALSGPQLKEAIVRPAEMVGLKIQPEVVEALVRELVGEPVGLPLLQFSLLRLWENRVHNRVTMDVYRRIGGGRYALAKAADELYDSLIDEEKRTAERILMKIVRPGEGEEITRDRVRRKTLHREDPTRVDRVLERFVNAHLLRLTPGESREDDRIEVAHEALVRNWKFLHDLLDSERLRLRERLRLTTAARHWETLARTSSAVWLGEQLQEALRQKFEDLETFEEAFLAASQAMERRNRQLRIAVPVAFVLVTLIALVVIAWNATVRANEQRDFASQRDEFANLQATARATAEYLAAAAQTASAKYLAERDVAATQELLANQARAAAIVSEAEARRQAAKAASRELASRADTQLETNIQLSLLLAVEANRTSQTSEAYSALRKALEASQVQKILRGHAGSVDLIAFSPDGFYLASAGEDGLPRLWNTGDGAEIGQAATTTNPQSLPRHAGRITALAFSPSYGIHATGGGDGVICLWDASSALLAGDCGAASALQDKPILLNHTDAVNTLAFSPDGARLVSASDDGTARIWEVLRDDVIIGQELWSLRRNGARVMRAIFSPDGSLVATASIDGFVYLWLADSGRWVTTLAGHNSSISALAFSPDGQQLASGDSDGNIVLWDAQRYVKLSEMRRHKDRITGLEFTQDGGKLASASADGSAILWELAPGGSISPLFLSGHSAEITSLDVKEDGALLLTASADNSARLWDANTGDLVAVLEGHSRGVNMARFMPGVDIVATASQDGTIRLWDWKIAKVDLVLRGFESYALDLAFSPAGDLLVGRGYDNILRIWTEVPEMLATGIARPAAFTIETGETDLPFGLGFSPDGEFLFATGIDNRAESGTVLIWDVPALLASGDISPWQVVHLPAGEVAFGLGVSARDNLLAVSSYNTAEEGSGRIYFWGIENLRQQEIPAEIARLEVEGLISLTPRFSPDGSLFIANLVSFESQACLINIWDVAQVRLGQKPEQILSHPTPSEVCYGAAIHPDGSLLATSGLRQEDGFGVLHLWDLANARLTGQLEEVTAFQDANPFLFTAFDPAGDALAAGSQEGELYLWDLTSVLETGSDRPEVNRLRGHQGFVYNVAFTPDGSWLASTSDDDTLRLWQINLEELLAEACRRAKRNLTQYEWETHLGRSILDYHLTCADYPGDLQVLDAIMETGREYAREGQEAEALSTFERALEMDPSLGLAPEAEVARVRGQEFAKKGEIEPALAAFAQVNEFYPDLELNPAEEVAFILIDAVEHDVELGVLTYQKEVAWALDYLRKAVELDPTASRVTDILQPLWDLYARKGEFELAFNVLEFEKELNAPDREIDLQEAMAAQLVSLASTLIGEGRLDQAMVALQRAYEYDQDQGTGIASETRSLGEEYVTRGQTDKGLEVLRWSAEVDPAQGLVPEEVAAGILLDNSGDNIRRGQYAEALQALRQAEELYPSLREEATSDLSLAYYRVCWEGSLEGQASLALPACLRAVELEPEFSEYRDGRGLARALTGDLPGAIEDFQFFVDNMLNSDPDRVRQRQAWIQALQNGENPFDEATLESLR